MTSSWGVAEAADKKCDKKQADQYLTVPTRHWSSGAAESATIHLGGLRKAICEGITRQKHIEGGGLCLAKFRRTELMDIMLRGGLDNFSTRDVKDRLPRTTRTVSRSGRMCPHRLWKRCGGDTHRGTGRSVEGMNGDVQKRPEPVRRAHPHDPLRWPRPRQEGDTISDECGQHSIWRCINVFGQTACGERLTALGGISGTELDVQKVT